MAPSFLAFQILGQGRRAALQPDYMGNPQGRGVHVPWSRYSLPASFLRAWDGKEAGSAKEPSRAFLPPASIKSQLNNPANIVVLKKKVFFPPAHSLPFRRYFVTFHSCNCRCQAEKHNKIQCRGSPKHDAEEETGADLKRRKEIVPCWTRFSSFLVAFSFSPSLYTVQYIFIYILNNSTPEYRVHRVGPCVRACMHACVCVQVCEGMCRSVYACVCVCVRCEVCVCVRKKERVYILVSHCKR